MSANKFWRKKGCALTAPQNFIAPPIAIVRPPAGIAIDVIIHQLANSTIINVMTDLFKMKRDKNPSGGKKVMTDGACAEGIFPVVLVKVNGVMCRALIDSGAGSSYASAKLINALEAKPSEIKSQRIDMLMTSQMKKIEIYDVTISSLDGMHEIKANIGNLYPTEYRRSKRMSELNGTMFQQTRILPTWEVAEEMLPTTYYGNMDPNG